jgi:transforming growth factor-beta-induced protein
MITNLFSNRLPAGLLAALLALAGCDDDPSPVQPQTDPDPLNIVETAEAAGSFSTLLTALDVAGLDSVLEGPGPFTVFAPTDAAFAEIPQDVLSDLLADTDLLTSVLTYHVVSGLVPAATVVGLSSATTVNGKSVEIEVVNGSVFLDGVEVVTTDIEASNGVIHVIDGVLTPEPIANIVQTAEAAGDFGTLLAAVEAAGLTDVLSGPGPFTVFAPTDAAFAQISEETLNGLLADPEALGAILTYHVVGGEVLAADVVQLDEAVTVNGASLQITVEGGGVRVNEASVVATDILARNGVVHVIDQVLIP